MSFPIDASRSVRRVEWVPQCLGCLGRGYSGEEPCMYLLAINHSVKDYDTWKAGYDAMPPTVAGAKFARVNRSVDDPNLITVVSGFESLDTLNAFVADPRLKDAMVEAGVIGSPRIEIVEEVEAI